MFELVIFPVPWWFSCRLALAFVGFLGFINLYALRVNMSVAMVCMVNQTAVKETDAPSDDNQMNTSHVIDDQCPAQTANKTLMRVSSLRN
jgi:ACS family sodium-dependent inorganic phosphate cotransporter-like MFS transporter 5